MINIFPKLISVKPLENFSIQVEYSDGKNGVVNLSDFAGKGVFSFWNKKENFNQVHVGKESGAVEWNEEIDMCPDNIYLKLINKSFEEYAQSE